jgi:hypothetical protein
MRESDLIATYGIPKAELKAFRETLKEGVDWNRVQVGSKPIQLCPVEYTEQGTKAVLGRFGVEGHKPAETDTFEAVVLRCNYPNPRIMTVVPDGRGPTNVQVSDNRLFFVGAKVIITKKPSGLFCLQRPESKRRLLNQNPPPK